MRLIKEKKEKKPKKELIRIAKNKDGIISLDRTGKADGRGAYICDQVECLDKVVKSKRLEKVLESKISEADERLKNASKNIIKISALNKIGLEEYYIELMSKKEEA